MKRFRSNVNVVVIRISFLLLALFNLPVPVQSDEINSILERLEDNYYIEDDVEWFVKLDSRNSTLHLFSRSTFQFLEPIVYALLTPKITFDEIRPYDTMSHGWLKAQAQIENLDLEVWDYGEYLHWVMKAPNIVNQLRERSRNKTKLESKNIGKFSIGFFTENLWSAGNFSKIQDT